MPDKKLLCLGYGYTARAFANRLRDYDWKIAGTTRSHEKADALTRHGVDALVWDGDNFEAAWLDGVSAMLISAPPDDKGCPALRCASGALNIGKGGALEWIGYLSTNGVYGDHDGAWVNEDSDLRGTSERALRRIEAEQAWRALARKNNLPLIIFRLPGIYGPGRSALDTVREGKAKRVYKQGQVFSRMHVDDITSALLASMERPRLFGLYNLADDEPAPPQDVIEYACTLLGAEPPPLVPIEEAALSPMAKSFYEDNKRVCNKRMKDALGLSLRFPTYRDGLDDIFRHERGSSV